jgi:hypothetical protein
VLKMRLMRPPRAGLPAMAVTIAAMAVGLLAPVILGVSGGGPMLIAARLAAAAPVCLLGLGLCLKRAGLLTRWPRPTPPIARSVGGQ